MQKLINRPDDFVDETVAGVLAAHVGQLRRAEDPRVIVRHDAPVKGRVAIVTGGGSGHLPLFMGYVGPGFADGVAVGNVFASPSSDQMLAAIQAVHGGRGVLQLYGNYGGDVMNFSLAADLARAEGIEVAAVTCKDDVASAPVGEENRRRGIAGIFFLYKIAGALAERGLALDELVSTLEEAAGGLRSIGVALAPCTVPSAGRATFELPAGEMEIGMGIHGEPGVRRGPLEPADQVADFMMAKLLAELPAGSGDRVDVLVNGLGATPLEELYILFQRVATVLRKEGITVRRAWVGEYATSLEMAGASVSLLVTNDLLAQCLDAPAWSPFVVCR